MDSNALFHALEAVQDRAIFLHFVQVLMDERARATRLEAEQPEMYRWSGALGWQHDRIEDYLEGALRCTQDSENRNDFLSEPTWRGFAEFLYCGKIYE